MEPTRELEENSKSTSDLAKVVKALVEEFSSQPGFMLTDEGFVVLHADWPAYPLQGGYKAALTSLADAGRHFFPIDRIDECTLFLADKDPTSLQNKFSEDLIHVAVWDVDLKELAFRGFIDGVQGIEENSLSFFRDSITITQKGYDAFFIHEFTNDVEPALLSRVEPFLYLARYDTVIREASVILEDSLRDLAGAGDEVFGLALVDKCLGRKAQLLAGAFANSERLWLRQEFRLYFKFVRNPFSHGTRNSDLLTCSRLLSRCSRLLRVVESFRKMKDAASTA